MYNTQRLLFAETPLVHRFYQKGFHVSSGFYSQGYTLIDGISSPDKAQSLLETFIASIDTAKLPLFARFLHRMQLAKADLIPVCADSVATSFQALHFDMGQPIVSQEPQTMYLVTGLYFPFNKAPGRAKTRVLSLKGLLADGKWGGKEMVEKKLLKYVGKYGDGWDDVNTRRLQCFARVIDAVSGTTELADYRDKTMAQWFQDKRIQDGYMSMRNEHAFYKTRGIPLDALEKHICLSAGQLLVIDNMRTAHGRIGKRNAKEIYQFMFGVKEATKPDIKTFRLSLVTELTSVIQ